MPPEVFLIISGYLVGYGAMHWYVLSRLGRVFPGGKGKRVVGWILGVGGVATPLAGRLAERVGAIGAGQWILGVGLEWMGVVMVGSMGIAAVELGALAVGRAKAKWVGWVGLGLGLVVMAWGWVQAGQIGLRHLRFTIGQGPYRLRIVHITDLHLGPPRGLQALRAVEALVSSLKPELVVCTGDVLDNPAPPPEWASALGGISAPLGVWAVTGNHERYMGLGTSVQFMRRGGWRVIDGQAWVVGGVVGLVGIGDSQRRDCALERRLVQALPKGIPIVVLKHRPIVCAVGKVVLQLSGHTHGGQVLPLGLGVWVLYRPLWGKQRCKDGRTLLVSRGCGTWGPPIRLWAPAEVWVIELEGLMRRPVPGATAMVPAVLDR